MPANRTPISPPTTGADSPAMADTLTAALTAMVAQGSLPMPAQPMNRKARRAAAKKKPAKTAR